jgi:hypothetical protein
MALVAYDVRLKDSKLYPLEALKVGVGAPVAKPRTALGATHAAADTVLHNNNVISRKNETWPWPNTLNAPRILYTTCTDQYPNFEPDWTLKPYRICTINLSPVSLTTATKNGRYYSYTVARLRSVCSCAFAIPCIANRSARAISRTLPPIPRHVQTLSARACAMLV